MAKVAYPGGSTSIVNTTAAATFIPELWSDEIVAAYKKNLVLANLVNKMSMVGKKGDTLHIPKPTRGSATAKAANTAVTIQADTESEVQISIDKHFEYSRFIEDIVGVQALDSMRRFYTDDAGYALALQLDDDLYNLALRFGDGTATDPTNPANWEHSNAYYVNAALVLLRMLMTLWKTLMSSLTLLSVSLSSSWMTKTHQWTDVSLLSLHRLVVTSWVLIVTTVLTL